MRSLLFCLAPVLIAGFSFIPAQTAAMKQQPIEADPSRRAATEELTMLARDAGHAYASRDLTALERLTADDYVQTDVRGGVLNRAQWLEFVRNRKSDLTVETDNVQVSFYGETAVVRGHWTYARQEGDKQIVTDSQWTSVWTHSTEGWKRHVFQNTYVNANADHCFPPTIP